MKRLITMRTKAHKLWLITALVSLKRRIKIIRIVIPQHIQQTSALINPKVIILSLLSPCSPTMNCLR